MSRQARSLDVVVAEVDAHAPNRSKASDGGLASSAHHLQNPTSDHEENAAGVWRARDITHDPAGGLNCNELATLLARELGKLPATGSGAYVIWNGRIISTDRLGEGWRAYHGANPHKHHLHLSVATLPRGYDDTTPWFIWGNQEDDMAAEDVWDHELVNAQPDGTKKKQSAGKLLTDIEVNVDNQAARLARIEAKLDKLLGGK